MRAPPPATHRTCDSCPGTRPKNRSRGEGETESMVQSSARPPSRHEQWTLFAKNFLRHPKMLGHHSETRRTKNQVQRAFGNTLLFRKYVRTEVYPADISSSGGFRAISPSAGLATAGKAARRSVDALRCAEQSRIALEELVASPGRAHVARVRRCPRSVFPGHGEGMQATGLSEHDLAPPARGRKLPP